MFHCQRLIERPTSRILDTKGYKYNQEQTFTDKSMQGESQKMINSRRKNTKLFINADEIEQMVRFVK